MDDKEMTRAAIAKLRGELRARMGGKLGKPDDGPPAEDDGDMRPSLDEGGMADDGDGGEPDDDENPLHLDKADDHDDGKDDDTVTCPHCGQSFKDDDGGDGDSASALGPAHGLLMLEPKGK